MAFSPPARGDSTYNLTPEVRRTLRFVVAIACEIEFPDKKLTGGHTVGDGYYYEADGCTLTEAEVKKIGDRIYNLVKGNWRIDIVKKPYAEVLKYFADKKLTCAKQLIETRVTPQVDCFECKGTPNDSTEEVVCLRLALSTLLPSTGELQYLTGGNVEGYCKLVATAPGFIASYAENKYDPQSALMNSHKDHRVFGQSYNVTAVGALNNLQQVGRTRKDYVLQCELRQEQKLATIAHMVKERETAGKPVKIICVAGPTSSGKTTFANKLCMYLMNLGFVAKPLTVDHYYLPLDRQPKYQANKQRSDVDYDHIESMDVELVGKHLNALANCESVVTPVYNMKTGYRDEPGHKIDALPTNGILVIEGIHALNPLYTQAVEASKVFKVFISPLTALQIDDANCVKTTYHRLLRRMCRDYLFRGNSASVTLKMWDNVRKGEALWIYPHQNGADYVMNSAAEYEIPILKTFIEPLLRAVTPDDPNFDKALEVLKLLDNFNTWPPDLAPPAALLREFIGDGAFDCH